MDRVAMTALSTQSRLPRPDQRMST